MLNTFLILIGKIFSLISKALNRGAGSTWPGHIALSINPKFVVEILRDSKVKIVFIAGTNGKTTTGRMITEILKKNGKRVFQNTTGANLLNGLASSLILHSSVHGKINYDYAIFEVDENTLPQAIESFKPHTVLCLNLFRDQLDRYGELDAISKKWKSAFEKMPRETTLVVNADDPLIASLTENMSNVIYFGLNEMKNNNKIQHASDSIYCPNCSTKLSYSAVTYSHLGNWFCTNCGLKRPKYISQKIDYPLIGAYNMYNAQAAAVFAQHEGLTLQQINATLKYVTPAFGRQEIIDVDGKKAQIFLSKNPASFNQSIETVSEKSGKTILFVLNDRIPDGRDVSWIWDIAIEDYVDKFKKIIISGDRTYDMALRVQYTTNPKLTNYTIDIEPNLKLAVNKGLQSLTQSETLYILPTYSAMLEVRKILTGRKIL